MSTGPIRRLLTNSLSCSFALILLACLCVGQQNLGGVKGMVTDQLGSLIVDATIVARDGKGVQRKTTTSSSGTFEFKSLPSGYYDLQVIAPGFDVLEEKKVEVTAGRATSVELQLSVAAVEQTVTVDSKGVSTDSDNNADAKIFRGRDLDTLPTDPQALEAALQAMAGPPVEGQQGAQVTVDGFSNGQMPPKEAIREIRINQNPFSSEYEYPGYGGIELYTQPGSDKWHGGGSFAFNDESLNSRNPFSTHRAPYQQRGFNANLTGPIVPKRASFTFYLGRYSTDSNSVVLATVLDPVSLKPATFNQIFVTPQVNTNGSFRGDLKIDKRNTLVGNYSYYHYAQDLQGIGGFSLPSRAYRGSNSYHTLQLTETAILSEKMINETRVQLIHNIGRQASKSALPALNVLDSFFDGGAQIGSASNRQDRAEIQNFTSWSRGNHFLKAGWRLRYVRVESVAPTNFGGTYTFAGGAGPRLDANDQIILVNGQPETIALSSLERYRRTLVFSRQGLSTLQIRNLGGGATQFSIAGGVPEARVSQRDVGVYVQDEWKLRPNLTISPGLRYENQTNIDSNLNFAPRLAFAWSPNFWQKKPTPTNAKPAVAGAPASNAPKAAPGAGPSLTVIRGGIGIFYNRIGEDLTLQALRYDGITQQQFILSDPSVLDLFPVVPPLTSLTNSAQPQNRRVIAADLAPSYSLRSTIGIERQLPHNVRLSLTYSHSHTLRTQRTVNINAPLPGGLRPQGNGAGNIQEYQSTGRSTNDNLNVNLSARFKKLNFWSTYTLGKTRNTDSGTSGSPFDPYDFSAEWGRSAFDIRHFFFGGGSYQARAGFSLNTFIIANSGQPFNITTGHDTNGDTSFSERPAFATDLTKPGVVVAPFGALDPNPVAGQRIIPRNLGQGPKFLSVNLGVEKVFQFGRAIAPKSPPPSGAGAVVTATSGGATTPPKQPVQRPYSFSLSIYAGNILNHTNKGVPVGNMASPYFLKSTGPSNTFFFGPGGPASGNRQLTLRARFSF
jgi:Carboxypeptidase regulatory-like domain/TonB dependent receptor